MKKIKELLAVAAVFLGLLIVVGLIILQMMASLGFRWGPGL